MTRVKQLVLALVVDLFLLFSIERFSFVNQPVLVQGFVYVTTLAAVMATLVIPRLRTWNVSVNVAIWLALFALGRVVLLDNSAQEAVVGFDLPAALAEAALLAMTVIIAHALAVALHDFSQAVENITLSGINHRLRRMEEVEDEIRNELERSRRYESPVSVIVVQPEIDASGADANRAVEEIQRAMMNRYVVASMASVLTNSLRRTDLVLEQGENGHFIIFTPETDVAHSAVIAEHIQSLIADRLQLQVRTGVAGFPDDALTFDELVRRAERNTWDETGDANPRYPVPSSVGGRSAAD